VGERRKFYFKGEVLVSQKVSMPRGRVTHIMCFGGMPEERIYYMPV